PNMGPLAVTSVVSSGDFTVSNDTCSGQQIAAESSCTFNVTFTPSQTKIRSGSVVVTDNAMSAKQTILLSGTGILAGVTAAPNSLPLGEVQVGTVSAAQSVTITNPNAVALDFTSISTSGPFAISTNTCDG